jgi:hypothetical protein
MAEITDEARAIMRENASISRRGGPSRTPIDMQAADQQPRGGMLSRVGQVIRDVWMGPGQTIHPTAPPDTPNRSWDYPLLWNYSAQPDAAKARESGVSMLQLRMLSAQTHIALAQTRVENQQKKKEWTFAVSPKPGETAHSAHRRGQDDPRITEVAQLFRKPDGENGLAEWLGMSLHNILTLGVTSIVPWWKNSGQPFRLEVYDPVTIKPVLDEGGRRPIGIDPATGLPRPAFQQYIKGVVFKDFDDANMLWYGPNPVAGRAYPVGPTEKLLLYINIALRKDIQRLSTYTDGNIPAGLIPLPTAWTPGQIEDWYNKFNLFVVNLPENMSKMVPIPYAGAGAQPIFPALEAVKDGWEDSWQRVVNGFFGLSTSAVLKEQTFATAQSQRQQATEEGEQYWESVTRRILNECIEKYCGYSDIVAKTQAEAEMDLARQAEIDSKRVSIGLDQPNELRDRDGKEPFPELMGVNVYRNTAGEYVSFAAALAASSTVASGDIGDPVADVSADSAGDAADLPKPTSITAKLQKKKTSAARSRYGETSPRSMRTS